MIFLSKTCKETFHFNSVANVGRVSLRIKKDVQVSLKKIIASLKKIKFLRREFVFLLFLIFSLFSTKSAIELSCEKTKYDDFLGTCFMKNTAINARKITIKRNESHNLTTINLFNNPNTTYLPEDLHESFPALELMWSGRCRIKTIEKKNFEKLSTLKVLDLSYNRISQIDSGTFDDLVSLSYLHLGE